MPIEDPKAHKLTAHLDFQPHQIYKLAYTMEDPKLRGRPVIFLRWSKQRGDIQRAVVALMNGDGSAGEQFAVSPSVVIPNR